MTLKAGNFFGASLDLGRILPNNDAYARLPEGERVAGEVVIDEIDTISAKLNEKKGMTCNVMYLVFKGYHRLTGEAYADMDNEKEISVWLPITFNEGEGFEPSKAEKREFADRIDRAERQIAGMYARVGSPLQPDASCGDRMAPGGTGCFASEEAWSAIRTPEGGEEIAFPVTIKASTDGSGQRWINWDVRKSM